MPARQGRALHMHTVPTPHQPHRFLELNTTAQGRGHHCQQLTERARPSTRAKDPLPASVQFRMLLIIFTRNWSTHFNTAAFWFLLWKPWFHVPID